MKNKLLICFNSAQLGGAERSMVAQAQIMSELVDIEFLIPRLKGEKTTLLDELIGESFANPIIHSFDYSRLLYSLSRPNMGHPLKLIGALIGLLSTSWKMKNIQLNRYEAIWMNGNKIAMPILVFALLMRWELNLVWHHRDYPMSLTRWARKILSLVGNKAFKGRISHIANSHSVLRSIESGLLLKRSTARCIYNPSAIGSTNSNIGSKKVKEASTIGVLAMMAPWKGIHQVVLWGELYKRELKELGVEKINIYGDQIYQTAGEHTNYFNEVKKLAQNDEDSFISFPGLVPPKEAFAEIDLLIHPSIRPEPFGRVILEAYRYRVPVISTGLGGSKELLMSGKYGETFSSFDYAGLFNKVRAILCNKSLEQLQVERAYKFSIKIDEDVKESLKLFLDSICKKHDLPSVEELKVD